jgi:16S rRNA (adenine1518-N6/adenine1519-N6)-dimethyltransferase
LNKRELVEYFESTGFRPKERLGQNFLIDPNLTRKLVDWAEPEPDDTVLEVGPGMGMITREILSRGVKLIAVERDAALKSYLASALLPEYPDTLTLIDGDAVNIPLGNAEDSAKVKVIANPPFSITGPWLAAILNLGLPKRFSLLLQKEAVDRITARAGSKLFGVLAMRLEAAYEVAHAHPVPASCFYPSPQVESRIVVFHRREVPYCFTRETLELVQMLFTQRRKQIGARVKQALSPECLAIWQRILESHHLGLQSRPEQIPTQVWIELDRATKQEV